MRSTSRSTAFTLVELLVVIGVIAVLISLLLPSLSRARESGNRIRCASNLRQLSLAMVSYATANRGMFPAAARNNYIWPEDWIYWTPGRDKNNSVLAKYIGPGKLSTQALLCPSDDLAAHPVIGALGVSYPYSYTLNPFVECRLPSVDGLAANYFGRALNLPRIRRASEKILVLEESEATINDGATAIVGFRMPVGSAPVPGSTDWLAVRHDIGVKRPDNSSAAGVPIPNPAKRGNVAFVDGHVELLSRAEVHGVAAGRWDPSR